MMFVDYRLCKSAGIQNTAQMIAQLAMLLAATLLLVGGLSAGEDCQQSDDVPMTEPVLQLANGDLVPGQVQTATSEQIVWASKYFLEPLAFQSDAIRAIRYPVPESPQSSQQPLVVRLANGDSIFGSLKSIDDSSVQIESPRMGQLTLARSSVREISLQDQGKSVLSGFGDLTQWSAPKSQKEHWSLERGTSLVTSKDNVWIKHFVEMPDAITVEIEIAWKEQLDFFFGFGAPWAAVDTEKLTRIETWDGSLALVSSDGYPEMVLESLPEDKKSLRLIFTLDKKAKRIAVADSNGKQLAELELPKHAKGIREGFCIGNKDGDLQVLSLEVRGLQAGYKPGQVGVLTDEEFIEGRVASVDEGKLIVLNNGEETTLPFEKVESIFFDEVGRESDSSVHTTVELTFLDGEQVKGKLESITANEIKIKTAYSEAPILCGLAKARAVFFREQGEGEFGAATHIANLDGVNFHGKLEPSSIANQSQLSWSFAGCQPARIQFGDAIISTIKKSKVKAIENTLDRVYLKNRDTMACRVVSIDDQFVRVRGSFGETELPIQAVRGIDFLTKPVENRWTHSEKVEQTDKGIRFETISGQASHVHALLAGGIVEFDMSWSRSTCGYLEVFPCMQQEAVGKPVFVLMIYDGQIEIGRSIQELGMGRGNNEVSNRKVKVSFRFSNGKLYVALNNNTQKVIRLRESQLRGNFLHFCAKGAGDTMIGDGQRSKVEISIDNFRASEGVGLGGLSESRKQHALTIPRFKQKNPPQNVIASVTGDLLRGNIQRFDGEHFWFESKMQEFKFTKIKIASLVWLDLSQMPKRDSGEANDDVAASEKIAARKEPVSASEVVQFVTNAGERLTLSAIGWDGDQVTGQYGDIGECKFDVEEISEIRLGAAADQARDGRFADWIAVPSKAVQLEGGSSAGQASGGGNAPPNSQVGKTIGDFSLQMLDGSELGAKDLNGKVIVLDFWATWCGPCVRSMPSIEKAVGEVESAEVVFAAVNLQEEASLINDFLESNEWETPVALDLKGKLAEKFAVESIPHTVVIDRQGRIAFAHTGAASDLPEKLKVAIQAALDAPTSPENEIQ